MLNKLSNKKNRVRELREAMLLSMAALAQKAGISYQTLSKMEQGTPTRKLTELKIAKALGKDYKDVFPEGV